METIGIRELKAHASEVVRAVKERRACYGAMLDAEQAERAAMVSVQQA